MSIVPGENWIGRTDDGGIWKPYVCARSGSFNLSTEVIETTVTGSGDFKTFEATVHGFTANIDGVISLLVTGSVTLADLQAKQLAKERMLWRFTKTDISGNIYVQEAYFYITNSTDTGSFDGISTFSISLQGTGALTTIFTPPSPTTGEVYRYPAMGSTAPVSAGTVSITVAGLGNKTILGVYKDGIGNNDIILSGTPVDKEVLYETSGSDGVFTWAIPFDGENWYCNYQNL